VIEVRDLGVQRPLLQHPMAEAHLLVPPRL
jgi:hypothetical protein